MYYAVGAYNYNYNYNYDNYTAIPHYNFSQRVFGALYGMENEEGDEFRSKYGVKKSAAVNETMRILIGTETPPRPR